MDKIYTINLSKEEINHIQDALNYYSVHYLQPKTDTAKYYYELWEKNLDIFCKMVELKEGE